MPLARIPDQDLEPPERHRFCSDDATLILDGHLRRLARGDARGRMGLGAASAMMMLAMVVAVLVPLMYLESRATRHAA